MSDFLRKVQLVEYDILKELDRVCKKYDIKWLLGQGTLLGAVKYGKFIPWDDDIDLLFYYDQYEKLLEKFKDEADEKYFLTNYRVERYFPVPWAKIRNKETLSRPVKYKELPINWGICIDIFPVYPISNNKLIRKLEYYLYKAANKMIMAEFTKFEEGHGGFVRLLEKLPLAFRHGYLEFVLKLLKSHKDKTEYVLITCKGVKVIKRGMLFGKENTLSFEDGVFPAPSDYHTYLTENYGDYMADLPEHLRKGHDLTMGDIEWRLPGEDGNA